MDLQPPWPPVWVSDTLVSVSSWSGVNILKSVAVVLGLQVDFMSGLQQEGRRMVRFTSDKHRKVVMYNGYFDVQDGVGHGTHTGGTIAGSR